MAAGAGLAIDVVVLAGGRSHRFGSDKLAVLLDTVLATLPREASVVCVGPNRPTRRPDVAWVRERPPMAGPLAAVAAGLMAGRAPVVVLVGGDMPRVGHAVTALLAALEQVPLRPVPPGPAPASSGRFDAAILVDSGGRPQVLASAWRRERLTARLTEIAGGDLRADGPTASRSTRPPRGAAALAGLPLRLLLQGATVVEVADTWGAAHDVDTPADLDRPP